MAAFEGRVRLYKAWFTRGSVEEAVTEAYIAASSYPEARSIAHRHKIELGANCCGVADLDEEVLMAARDVKKDRRPMPPPSEEALADRRQTDRIDAMVELIRRVKQQGDSPDGDCPALNPPRSHDRLPEQARGY